MKVSRRDFLKISAGVGAATTLLNPDILKQALAVIFQNRGRTNLLWVHGQNCTGCTISMIQWCGDPVKVLTGSPNYMPQIFTLLGNIGYYAGSGGILANGLGPYLPGYTDPSYGAYGGYDLGPTDIEFLPTAMPQAGAYYSSDGTKYYAYQMSEPGDPIDMTYVDAVEWLKSVANDTSQATFVIVEGSIPYEKWGDNEEQGYCEVGMELQSGGYYEEGKMWNFYKIIEFLATAPGVLGFIALGNCGSFAGIPGGNPNPTGAKGLWHFLQDLATPPENKISSVPLVINLNGCPANPEHLVLTYAAILQGLNDAPSPSAGKYIQLDQWQRPAKVSIDKSSWIGLYDKQVHDDCERKDAFDKGIFATSFTEAIESLDPSSPYYDSNAPNGKCLLRLGCRGPDTWINCSNKTLYLTAPAQGPSNGWNPAGAGLWNHDRMNPVAGGLQVNDGMWCVAAGAPCNGCSTTTYPDNVLGSSFFRECTHSKMLANKQIPGDASGATPDFERKGIACYTCHAVSMPLRPPEAHAGGPKDWVL